MPSFYHFVCVLSLVCHVHLLNHLAIVIWASTSDFSTFYIFINEPQHEISSNVVCATSIASDQPVHMRSPIRAFASRLNII